MAEMPKTPQHDRLMREPFRGRAEVVEEFVDWLYERGWCINRDIEGPGEDWIFSDNDKRKLTFDFLGLDLDAFYAEKDALIAYIRKENEDGPPAH